MRLRQVALASRRLDEIVGELERVFGLKVAYNDPAIIHYGLRNAVLSAGDGFLEVVEPVRDGSSAGRFIDRRGGDAGYMVILQTADVAPERQRAVDLGVRVVDDLDSKTYRAAHFHPADFGGVLVSFDQQLTETDHLKRDGDWFPAGQDWRDTRTEVVTGLEAVTIATPDPEALARRWAELLGRPREGLRIPLDRGEIRFGQAQDGAGTTLAGIELEARDPADVMHRALSAGLATDDGALVIGGVRFDVS